MISAAKLPLISVVIPTFNRAALLKSSLESFAQQSISKDQYEVVVVDDGSTDTTPEVCQNFSARVSLKYVLTEHSGVAAAKNAGVFNSSGSILVFFDDDETAEERLLEEHLKIHQEYPQENVAVLGYTTWAPSLEITPVMEYVADIGQMLLAYRDLEDGQVLDFTYFWGGSSSCKRSLLTKHGVFDRRFRSALEDIELGYRLSRVGLKVIFNRHALKYMIRPITFDAFCRRCENQGRSMYLFSRLHPDPAVQRYCQIRNPDIQGSHQTVSAEEKWHDVKPTLEEKVRRVTELEQLLTAQTWPEERAALMQELKELYWWTFNAFKIKGMVEAKRELGDLPGSERAAAEPTATPNPVPAKKGSNMVAFDRIKSAIRELKSVVGARRELGDLPRSGRAAAELTATPNPVPPGPGLGETTIAWSTGDSSPGRISLSVDGGPERLFVRGAQGVKDLPWIHSGRSYEFRLYGGEKSGEPLAAVTVTRSDEVFLIAEPNPVPAREGSGKTTISWSTGDVSPGRVSLSTDGESDKLFAQGARGSKEIPWISLDKTYEFRLYSEEGKSLATVIVTRSKGGIEAEPGG